MKAIREDYLVEFKSIPDNYYDECNGNKPNTVRIIDWDDERFSLLNLMRNRNTYGFIKIRCTEDCQSQEVSFKRKITNVTIWNKQMIVSWSHKEANE